MSTEQAPNPREIFLASLDEEKRRYVKELDIMSDVVSLAMGKIENNPDVEEAELESLLDDEKILELTEKERRQLRLALEQFIKRREVIKRYYLDYKDNPEQLFQELTGKTLSGGTRLVYTGWLLTFIVKQRDFEALYRSATSGPDIAGGVYFTRGHPAIKLPELSGKVCFVRGDYDVFVSRGERSEVEIQGTAKHESSHAFWRDYLREVKENSLASRVEFDRKLILDEETGKIYITDNLDKLSSVEQRQAAEFMVRLILDNAIDLYFTGNREIISGHPFVREGGPQVTVDRLAESLVIYYKENGGTNLGGAKDFFRTIKDSYRERFFILYDVLQEVGKKIPKAKLEALCCLLPSDRIERVLYFINIDPKKWLEQWHASNTLETLPDRELRHRIDEDPYEGL